MSTNAQVRTAWSTNVFASINGGANSYAYAIDPDSMKEMDLGMYGQIVDFWTYEVNSEERPYMFGKNQITFTVTITGYREQDEDGSGTRQNALRDDFRTINDSVNDTLLTDWDSTVDYWEGPDPLTIEAGEWGSKPVWIGTTQYTALQTVNN